MKEKKSLNNIWLLLIIFSLTRSALILPQANRKIDSLKQQLSLSRTPQDSVSHLNKIVWAVALSNSQLANNSINKSLQLLKKIKNQETVAETYDALALTYWVNKNLTKAKEYYTKALVIGNKYEYKSRVAWETYHLAIIALKEGDSKTAFEFALKSRRAWQELNNQEKVLETGRLLRRINKNEKAYTDTLINDLITSARFTSDSQKIIGFYSDLVSLYGAQENKNQSMIYALKALDLAEKINDEKGSLFAYQKIANYLRDSQHNYEIALLYYQKILDINKKYHMDKVGLSDALRQIGIVYILMDNKSLALSYFNQSLELALKVKHRHVMANAYESIGEISYLLKNYKDALAYYSKCYAIGCDECPKIAFHRTLINMGNIYLQVKDYRNAINYFQKSLLLADSANANYEKAVSYSALGDFYLLLNENSKAFNNYFISLKLAASVKSLSLQKEISSKLSKTYQNQNDYQKAFEYLTMVNSLTDTLNKLNEVENLSRLETKFQFQNLKFQKEHEIKENQISSNAEIEKQAQIKYFFLISFILTSIFGIIFYRNNRLLKDQKKQLEEMSIKIHEADQKKLSFFSNISHELRTPLTLILGPIEKMIKENAYKNGNGSLLEIVRRNTLQLYNLIDQLLDIRKLDTGNITLKVSEGDLNEYIRGLYSTFSHLAEENNIAFTFNSSCEKISGWFDKDIVEKALNNLLSNAFKYTPKNGAINVSLLVNSTIGQDISFVKIIVSDNGKGIPEEHLQYVFNRYYQVENSNTGFNTGTGIGLAYTKELIELHKGSVNVESKLNYGTIFTVELPIHESYYQRNEKSTKDIPSNAIECNNVRQKYLEELISRDNKHISIQNSIEVVEEKQVLLIVEDNLDLRTFIKSIFANDYKICEAPDGIIGYQMAKEIIPDVIISDIMMPGMNGLELCNKLKNDIHTNHIPILILTAKGGEENEIEGLKTGADDYLTKPFQSEVLELRIARLIEAKERMCEYFKREFLLNPSELKIISPEDEFLQKAVKIVEENISNLNFDTEIFMKELGVSKTQLFRKLKALTGYSATQFIRNIKLKRAAQLLQQSSYNITEVLYLSGFNSHSYFINCFKEMYGCLPKEYQSRIANTSVLMN